MPPASRLSTSDQSHQCRTLTDRCGELGLFCWRMDSNACIVDQPNRDGLIGAWLQSPALQLYVVRAARGWLDTETPKIVEPFPGCWLLPIVTDHAENPPKNVVVAMALGQPALETEQFEAICAGAALGREQGRSLFASIARYGSQDLATLQKALRWSQSDLNQNDLHQRAIEEFSERLIQSYEETNFLFKLARYMNCITVPAEMIEASCRQMLEILPFEWIAIVFNDTRNVARGLAGKLTVAGALPCHRDIFQNAAQALLGQHTLDDWTRLLQPGDSGLATLVGSEVIFDPIAHNTTAIGGLLAGNKRGPDNEVSSVETQLLDAAADFLGVFHENVFRFEEQRSMFLGTLRALSASIDAKHRYTRGHSDRVSFLGTTLAQAIEMDAEKIERVRIAGLVHDVGKIGVPEAVLSKQGRLTFEEYEQIKQHPVIGYEILKGIPPMHDVLPGVLYHHERWDGKGYPEGLRGENIPLFGRLLALADTFDAMKSNRSYRSAMPNDQVLEEIRRCAETQFDPALANVFVKLDLSGYEQMVAKHLAEDSADGWQI